MKKVIVLAMFMSGMFSVNAGMTTFGTGMDGAIGEPDQNIELVDAPISGLPLHPFIANPYPIPIVWNTPFEGTNWIVPIINTDGLYSAIAPPGIYSFNLSFELPESFESPELSIQYYTDNDMVSVLLNDNPISFTPSPQVDMGEGGTDNAQLFLPGVNTLTFGVSNWSSNWNPMGVNLIGTVNYVPEPTTCLLLLGALPLMRRRKSK